MAVQDVTTQLEDLSLCTRISILAIVVVLTCAALFVLEAEGEQSKLDMEPYLERILQLDRQAAEEAYVQHIMRLFNVWVLDYSDEPPKGIKGAQQARSAYVRIMQSIEKREREMEKKR